MAFLHRVVNGGGILEREYAIGSDRMDLCLRYGSTILGIELKVWRGKKGDPQADSAALASLLPRGDAKGERASGLEQLDSYLARLAVDFCWLFVFDRREKAPPIEERLSTQFVSTKNQRSITVFRA